MKNWGLDLIGFTVVPTLIFDMTKAKALYVPCEKQCSFYFKKYRSDLVIETIFNFFIFSDTLGLGLLI